MTNSVLPADLADIVFKKPINPYVKIKKLPLSKLVTSKMRC